jgi:hypothetical protein
MNPQCQIDGRRRKVGALIAVLFALVAVAAALERVDTSKAPARMTAVPTGEITPEGPVYRLPPIYVVADRKTELARIEREDKPVSRRSPIPDARRAASRPFESFGAHAP